MTAPTHALYETSPVAATEVTVYTSAARTLVDRITSFGLAAVPGDVTIKYVSAGAAAAAGHTLAKKTFGQNESFAWPELTGHTLEAGDFISVLGSVASGTNLRISGRLVT